MGQMRGWTTVVAGAGALFVALAGSTPAAGQESGLLDREANLEVWAVSVEEALQALQQSSGVTVAFSRDLLPEEGRVDCACTRTSVRGALERILRGTGLEYREGRRQVLVGRDLPGERPGTSEAVVGQVVEEEWGRPVPSAEVRLTPSDRTVATGNDGRFVFPGASPEEASVSVEALGYEPIVHRVAADGTAEVVLRRAPLALEELVIAPGSYGILEASPDLSGAAVTREDIEAIPQFGDDAFRTLKRMPGVSSDDISTRLNVRGGTDRDVLVRLDGVELFEPYHLKDLDGALGIVDVQSLGSIDLVTGGFPVEYGDKSTAIFDMSTRKAPPGGTRTTVGMSLSSLSLNSQGRFGGDRGQWLASLRRGFLEYVLAVGGVEDEMSPAYWDVLARVQYLATEDHLVAAQLLYAGDAMAWTDEATGSRIDSDWANGYGWLTWRARLGSRLEATTLLSGGRLTRERIGRASDPRGGAFAPLSAQVDDRGTFEFGGVRQEWTAGVVGDLLLKAGFEFRRMTGDYDYASRARRLGVGEDARLVELVDSSALALETEGDEAAAWGAVRSRLGSVVLEAGLRWDQQSHTGDETVAPRVLGRWDLDSVTTLRGSWGRYVQSQGVHELAVEDGRSTFEPRELANQTAVGLERRFSRGLTARLEAYLRETEDPHSEYVNLSREVNPMSEVESDRRRLTPEESRARGVEFFVGQGGADFDWSASYALAEAENRVEGRWIPRTLDQRHTVNVHGSLRFGAWRLSGSWQYHTGWPFTEQVLDVAVVEDGEGQQVDILRRSFGPLNDARLPAYHRMDLRLTRAFQLQRSRLEVFLDIFNAYDRTNLRGWQWDLRDPDGDGVYSAFRSSGEEQLPLLPTIGFRWTF